MSEPTPATTAATPVDTVDLGSILATSNVEEVLDGIERDLVGLVPVKRRIRELASLFLVDRARRQLGVTAGAPSLHMCFTGNPGSGKTTVGVRMAEILRRLGYLRRGHLVSVTRDDLVGQYVGHTAPKTKEALKRAMGGVLFIDEAYALSRPENERDYGPEAIDILLQGMESAREELVVILAGYRDRMDAFFDSNPGMASRVAHHIEFPDYSPVELLTIGELMLERLQYHFSAGGRAAFAEYLARRMARPRFANGRSVRNALDRARLRQASRICALGGRVDRATLTTIEAEDIRRSSLFDEAGPAS
ncbi:MAG: CbbX [bacterium]|nr:CbbX [bacterium]